LEEEILSIIEDTSLNRSKINKLLEPIIQKHLDCFQEAANYLIIGGEKLKISGEEFPGTTM